MRTLQDQMREKGLSNTRIREIEESKGKTSERLKETLSQRDIEELMNVNANTYIRGKGGAIRRRR